MNSLWQAIRKLAPYLVMALLVPGGSFLAIGLWIARHKRNAQLGS